MPIFSPEQLKQFAAQVAMSQQQQPQSQDSQQDSGLGMGYKAGLVGSNLFDAVTTRMALRSNPNAAEGNPVMSKIANSTPAMLAMKGGIGAAEAYVLDKLSQKHPKIARALALGGIAVPSIAGVSNLTKMK